MKMNDTVEFIAKSQLNSLTVLILLGKFQGAEQKEMQH